jgi:hypothetical protein
MGFGGRPMKNLISVICLFALTACALPAAKSSNQSYLTGSGSVSDSSDTIKHDLTREQNVYGHYFVSAYPMTEPFIRASETEAAKKEMSSPEETQARVEKQLNALAKNRTCFQVALYTSSIGYGEFKYWKGKFETADGKLIDASFDNTTGVESVPGTVDPGFTGHGYDWGNYSYLCGPKLDLTKSVKIHVIPTFKDAPVATLQWTQQASITKASN